MTMVLEGWTNFIVAFAIFLLSHMVLVRPPIRPVLVRGLGQRGFSAGYSLLSLLILWWLIEAAQAAPYVEIWPWAPWQNWVPILAMVPACLILAFGVAVPNPLSFGGSQNGRFNPEKPGIVGKIRHPILLALFLWSAAHLIPNGNLAHIILFGAFALFSLLGMTMIDVRRHREMGEDWTELTGAARVAPFGAGLDGKQLVIRLFGAVTLYAVLIGLHPLLTGVSPIT